ncbi:Uncharacterized protein Fot_37773 [Forsythia ovata]|uniref:Uncharacterized protein n=1 Tax=Forsythia ovata TaxID=205694 RepID=A0ABD1RZX6_9LAMI
MDATTHVTTSSELWKILPSQQLREMYEPSTTSLMPPAEKVKTKGRLLSKVNLKSNCPIPPVACNWYKYKDNIASGWKRPYKARIDVFKKMIGHPNQGIENMHGRSVPRKKRNKRLHSTKGKIWMAQPLEECEGSNPTEEHVSPLIDPYTVMISGGSRVEVQLGRTLTGQRFRLGSAFFNFGLGSSAFLQPFYNQEHYAQLPKPFFNFFRSAQGWVLLSLSGVCHRLTGSSLNFARIAVVPYFQACVTDSASLVPFFSPNSNTGERRVSPCDPSAPGDDNHE